MSHFSVSVMKTVLSHLHYLCLQQWDTPLHCVSGSNRDWTADVRRTPAGHHEAGFLSVSNTSLIGI